MPSNLAVKPQLTGVPKPAFKAHIRDSTASGKTVQTPAVYVKKEEPNAFLSRLTEPIHSKDTLIKLNRGDLGILGFFVSATKNILKLGSSVLGLLGGIGVVYNFVFGASENSFIRRWGLVIGSFVASVSLLGLEKIASGKVTNVLAPSSPDEQPFKNKLLKAVFAQLNRKIEASDKETFELVSGGNIEVLQEYLDVKSFSPNDKSPDKKEYSYAIYDRKNSDADRILFPKEKKEGETKNYGVRFLLSNLQNKPISPETKVSIELLSRIVNKEKTYKPVTGVFVKSIEELEGLGASPIILSAFLGLEYNPPRNTKSSSDGEHAIRIFKG